MPGLAGLATGAVGMIGSLISGFSTKNKLNKDMKNDPTYQQYDSPELASRLGLAKSLLNARMPGAARAEQLIQGNQANAAGSIDRNASSGAQALSMLSASEGQTNDAFGNLQTQEAQDYYNRLGNLTGAQTATATAQTAEHDKSYNDTIRKWQDKINVIMAKNAINNNMAQSVTNFGGTLAGKNKPAATAAASTAGGPG